MSQEGFARVRHERHDVAEGLADARAERRDAFLEDIVRKVHEVDASQKALTGRKPEQYSQESGLKLAELFPEDGDILNIGDPWQALDLPGVVSVDYESGEEAEFIRDADEFVDNKDRYTSYAKSFLESVCRDLIRINPSAAERLDTLQKEFAQVCTLPEESDAKKYDGVGDGIMAFAKNFTATVNEIIEEQKAGGEYIGNNVREFWYVLQILGSNFKDVYLWKEVIESGLRQAVIERKGLTSDEENKLVWQIVHQHRFVRRMKHADYIQGTFPVVPFTDHSFDRIVASWSISTHMFPVMDRAEFDAYWEEIDRLLKKDGVAYMWPIYRDNEFTLTRSLQAYFDKGGDAWAITSYGEVYRAGERDFYFALAEENCTLAIFPKGADLAAKERVKNSIVSGTAPVQNFDNV